MRDFSHEKFDITINMGSKENKAFNLEIRAEETTDGVPYFVCETNGVEISQLRRNEYNEWEQLWGDLDIQTVKNIGEAIEQHEV